MKRVYFSGPMTGKPDFNYPAFNALAAIWRNRGYTIHNPAENFAGDTRREYATYIRADIEMLLDSDAIAMLPGWRDSRGAKFELLVAKMLGLEVLDATTMLPYPGLPEVTTALVA